MKSATGDPNFVYFAMTTKMHLTLGRLAAAHDISIIRLLERMINEFVEDRKSEQQSIPEDSEFVPTTENDNGEETGP